MTGSFELVPSCGECSVDLVHTQKLLRLSMDYYSRNLIFIPPKHEFRVMKSASIVLTGFGACDSQKLLTRCMSNSGSMWPGFSVVSFRDRARLGHGSALVLLHQTLFRPHFSTISPYTCSPLKSWPYGVLSLQIHTFKYYITHTSH